MRAHCDAHLVVASLNGSALCMEVSHPVRMRGCGRGTEHARGTWKSALASAQSTENTSHLSIHLAPLDTPRTLL